MDLVRLELSYQREERNFKGREGWRGRERLRLRLIESFADVRLSGSEYNISTLQSGRSQVHHNRFTGMEVGFYPSVDV
jgi:hypothetical protein